MRVEYIKAGECVRRTVDVRIEDLDPNELVTVVAGIGHGDVPETPNHAAKAVSPSAERRAGTALCAYWNQLARHEGARSFHGQALSQAVTVWWSPGELRQVVARHYALPDPQSDSLSDSIPDLPGA